METIIKVKDLSKKEMESLCNARSTCVNCPLWIREDFCVRDLNNPIWQRESKYMEHDLNKVMNREVKKEFL